jgi:hypothetical protein
MRTVTIIIVGVFILLFLASFFLGSRVFSPYERTLDRQLTQTTHLSPQTAKAARKIIMYKKVRLAFSSFDLVGGLTAQDLEDLANPFYRVLSFFFLFACVWVVFGFKILRH